MKENDRKISLTEETRNNILSRSRKGLSYSGKTKENRGTAKSKCRVSNTVKDYNKIDMNTFGKQDLLDFKIQIEGETSNYYVTIQFSNIQDRIQREIKRNKNKLESQAIYRALFSALNTEDVKIDCSCPDFKYRFAFGLSQHNDKAGEKETRRSTITNPDDKLGSGCKHVLYILNNLDGLNKIASVITNYINYCKDNMEYNYARFIFPKVYGMSYNDAVQLTIDDFDEKGNLKNDLQSDEATINLANALGKVRGRFKKGSNKNPVTQKEQN